MELPKGNPLIEQEKMTFFDLETLYNNLKQEAFTGYIRIDYQHLRGYLFVLQGGFIYAVEELDDIYRITHEDKLFLKARREDIFVSVYILPPPAVTVLSQVFAYNTLPVENKDLKEMLKDFERGSYSGIIQVTKGGISFYLLIEDGLPISDSILDNYGEIICGFKSIEGLIVESREEGVEVKLLLERGEELELKKEKARKELNKLKILYVVGAKGLIGSEGIRVDNLIMEEWENLGCMSQKGGEVILETFNEISNKFKVAGKKNLGTSYVEMPVKLMKSLGLEEGESVTLKPIG